MKTIKWIAWISAGIGGLFLLLAAISIIFGTPIREKAENIINFFHAANSFFLVTIALFIFVYRCETKK